jgi:2-keto-3-deoxy-L-rhamnonate aldolase RhmA
MRIRTNTMKARLKGGEVVIGAGIGSYSPEMVELLGALGFDHVTIDCEHLPMDEREVENLIRAGEAFDTPVIVRIQYSADLILRYLDAGAAGLHIPRINTAEQVRAVVEACRFHPEGKRTVYEWGRGARFGMDLLGREYTEMANREVFVLCQLEEVEAVQNLSDILAVPGIDCIQIGPKDLWQSMGMPEQAEVNRTIDFMIGEIVKAGIPVSMVTDFDADMIRRRIAQGVKKFEVGVANIIKRGATEILQQIKELAAA